MKNAELLLPKLFTMFKRKYSWNDFVRDLMAGLVVGAVALPLSIAFGIASGVKPEQGIITAIVGGFIVSVLSGSRVQIGGPTGAFIVIVYHIIQQYGYEGLAVATLMAGGILIVMGVLRFGRLIEFIPYPITVGFTSGIAVIIFTSQIPDFLGMHLNHVPAEFIEKVMAIGSHIGNVNFYSILLGILSIVIITQTSRFLKKIPGSIVAILVMTFLVHYFHLPVETIQTRFGSIPTSLPVPSFPEIHWSTIRELMMPATTIALLAGLESLLSAVVADGMTGLRHRSNMELIAQGAANIGSVLFGGIPVTGAIARTATNIKNGGRSPIAGIVHALTLLVILLVFGKWAGLIPIPVLAAILIVVAYHMSEWRMFVKLFQSPKSDIGVLLTTFGLTIFVDLTVAIQVGFVLAAFLFMKRMAEMTEVESVTDTFYFEGEDDEDNGQGGIAIPQGVEVFEINGPFFFGAANKFKSILSDVQKDSRILILRMRHVPVVDATGLMALEHIVSKCHQSGVRVILSGVREQPQKVMEGSGLDARVGKENIFSNIEDALKYANELVRK